MCSMINLGFGRIDVIQLSTYSLVIYGNTYESREMYARIPFFCLSLRADQIDCT